MLLGLVFPQGKAETFVMPKFGLTADNRVTPHPLWIGTRWDVSADTPFVALEAEMKKHLKWAGWDTTGVWPKKAKAAYLDWFHDCQDPRKLYRAAVYYDIANGCAPKWPDPAEAVKMGTNLMAGWLILRNPPRSYLFARYGYCWTAHDRNRHDYGHMARALLERNPKDRVVACAMADELRDNRDKWKELEEPALSVLIACRDTDNWKPWSERYVAALYEYRAMRTRRRADMQKAIDTLTRFVSSAPTGYDAKQPKADLEWLKYELTLMTRD